jgi:hypothetical protein
LLEIGPVVLVMPPGDGQAGLIAAAGLLGRIGVGAGEGHGGRVVVQLIEPDPGFLDGMGSDRQGEGTAVAAEELIEGACEAIVIEGGDLLGCESQGAGIDSSGPGGGAVEGLAGEQEVLEQDHQDLRRGEARPAILRGQIVAEGMLQSQAREQAVDDGQQPELIGVDGPSGGLGGVARGRGLPWWAWHG